MTCKRIDAAAAASLLKENDCFLILTHASPDGDTLGSGFALRAALESLGKKAKVICPDAIPKKFNFIAVQGDTNFEPKTVVAVDVADDKLLGKLREEFNGKIDLCIDHHKSNNEYAKRLYLEGDSGAATECVYNVIAELGAEITPYIASCLYLGMATDTGCFKFSNTTPRTHIYSAKMMEFGACYDDINRVMFETKSRGRIEMEKLVLESMEFFFGGKCAVITVTDEMIKKTGCSVDELDGVTAMSRQIEGVLVGVTIKEKEDGRFKVSVRTFEPFDAAAICAKHGGGGHMRAAGCEFKLPATEVKELLLSTLEEFFNEKCR